MSRWVRGGTEVRWSAGALWVRSGGTTLLVDAPPGVEGLLPDQGVDHVLLTSGRVRAVGGLLGLLAAVDTPEAAPLEVHTVLGDERAFALADVWSRHWPHVRPVELDGRRPGTFTLPSLLVTTALLPGAELVGGAGVPTTVVGVRVRTADATVACAPPCRPGTTVGRLLSGADLALVTLGGPVGWRHTAADAALLGPSVVAIPAEPLDTGGDPRDRRPTEVHLEPAIDLTATFPHVTPDHLWATWVDGAGHAAMTGAPAASVATVGGAFTAWEGYITGRYLALEPGRRLRMAWRTTQFPAGAPDSEVDVELTADGAGTRLHLRHTGAPADQVAGYTTGWEEYYFAPMRRHFT